MRLFLSCKWQKPIELFFMKFNLISLKFKRKKLHILGQNHTKMATVHIGDTGVPSRILFINASGAISRLVLSFWFGWSLRHVLDKVTWWHFQSTSKEVIWPKKFLNYMHGLKSAISAIFQKGLGWPCPVSAALKNAS